MSSSSCEQEGDAHKPSNPYSASKSAAEMICQSYFNTYRVPLVTMNVMNAFGERQHPEKFIPLCISHILRGEIAISRAEAPSRSLLGAVFAHPLPLQARS